MDSFVAVVQSAVHALAIAFDPFVAHKTSIAFCFRSPRLSLQAVSTRPVFPLVIDMFQLAVSCVARPIESDKDVP